MSRPTINPYFSLVIGVLSVSTSAVLVKLASSPAPITALYRLLFAVLLMTPLFLIRHRKELRVITRRDWVYSTIAGVFLALHFILWFESLEYTSVASSVVLVTLQPIFAFIGTFLFFGERLTKGAILSGILAMSGSVIISWGDFRISGMALFGDLLALLGAVMVTGYFLFGQTVRKRVSLMTYTYIVYGISSLTLFLYSLFLQHPFFHYPKEDWLLFALLAVFPTLLGHSLFNWAIKWLSTSIISMSILFEPIGASILAYYILGETVRIPQWIGGFLVLVGIFSFLYMNKLAEKRKQIQTAAYFHKRKTI